MPSITINWAQITQVRRQDGTVYNRVNRPGANRLWERVWIPSTTTTQVNDGYWVDPDPYWEFVRTGQYYTGSGRWNFNNPDLGMWPDGSPSNFYSGNGGYNWTHVGNYEPGDGYSYWRFEAYQFTGYEQYVDPGPYWQDNWITVTVDNSYWAYYY